MEKGAPYYLARIHLWGIAKVLAELHLQAMEIETGSRPKNKRQNRNGGFLAIEVVPKHLKTYDPTAIGSSFGNPGKKIAVFAANAFEKINRIVIIRKEGGDDFASSQSEDREKKQWGGCIRAVYEGNEIFISIAGAHPIANEALAYTICKLLKFELPNGYRNPLLESAETLLQGFIKPR